MGEELRKRDGVKFQHFGSIVAKGNGNIN